MESRIRIKDRGLSDGGFARIEKNPWLNGQGFGRDYADGGGCRECRRAALPFGFSDLG